MNARRGSETNMIQNRHLLAAYVQNASKAAPGSRYEQSLHENGYAFNAKIKAGPTIAKNEVAERLTDMGKHMRHTANAAKHTKKSRLLSNPDIKRWYDNLARGSKLTAEGRLRRLNKFCEMHQTTPMQLADLAARDLKTATDMIEDHVTAMEAQNYAPGYIADHIKTVKSWLAYWDIEIRRKIKINRAGATPTLRDERVPETGEMSEIYGRAGLRESVIISLMAKSGLRPEVIGNHDGTDGLQMRDLPDIVIHQGMAKRIRKPCRIIVRQELSKARHQYFTFATDGAADQILAYLNDRLVSGEPLNANSPVAAPDYIYRTNRGRNAGKPFLPTPRVSRIVREVFRPRFAWRPYVLRAYFDTQLLIAESRGKIAHDFRVFFMGHKGTMESRYTTNKGVLPEALVKEMRDAFARSEEYLEPKQASRAAEQEQRDELRGIVENASPQALGAILEVLEAHR